MRHGHGGIVVDLFGVDGFDEGKVVGYPGGVGQSSLTHAPELPRCAKENLDGTTGKLDCDADMPVRRWPPANGIGKVGTLEFFESRFIVEQFDLRRTAGLEQINDAFGFGSEIRKAGETRLAACGRCSAQVALEQRR